MTLFSYIYIISNRNLIKNNGGYIFMNKLLVFFIAFASYLSMGVELNATGKRSTLQAKKSKAAKKTAFECQTCGQGPFSSKAALNRHLCDELLDAHQEASEEHEVALRDEKNESSDEELDAVPTHGIMTFEPSGYKLAKKPADRATKKFVCTHPDCSQLEFAKKSTYDDHILKNHLICPVCDCTIKGPLTAQALLRKLARHLVDDCKKKAIYVCNQQKHGEECLFISLYKDRAEEHAISHSNVLGRAIDVRKEFCTSHLNYDANDEESVQDHTTTKHERKIKAVSKNKKEAKFSCPLSGCEKGLSSQAQLDQHIIADHYCCPNCDFGIEKSTASYDSLKELADHILNAPRHTRRDLYLCNEVCSDGSECLYINLKSQGMLKHAAYHHHSKKDIEVYHLRKKERKDFYCPYKDFCEEAANGKDFKKSSAFKEHIAFKHIDCPFGDSIELCPVWDEERNKIADDFYNQASVERLSDDKKAILINQELYQALALHVKNCHSEEIAQICKKCTNFITIFKNGLNKHKCAQIRNRAKVIRSIRPFASPAMQGEPVEQDFEASEERALEFCDEKVFVKDDELSGDAAEQVSSDYEMPVWCWLTQWTVEKQSDVNLKLQSKCCFEALKSDAELVKHFQSKHRVCFDCIKNKALFATTQDLLAHQQNAHSGEPIKRSKCPVYKDKKVCVYCSQLCKYESEKELKQHVRAEHRK